MTRETGILYTSVLIATMGLTTPALANQDAVLQPLLAEGGAATVAANESQGRVDQISKQTDRVVTQYRNANKRVEGLKAHVNRLRKQIEIQRLQIRETDREIANVAVLKRQMPLLMDKMTNALEQFISLDLPFHQDERNGRVQFVRDAIENPKVSASEKLRQVLSAYAVESEYGRKLDSYNQVITMPDGVEREVSILRMGRVSMMYLTKDERESGYYNRKENRWEELPSSFRNDVRKGIRIAQKQAAVALMLIPVDSAEEAR